jgi:hypothetical protein
MHARSALSNDYYTVEGGIADLELIALRLATKQNDRLNDQ